MLDLSVLIEGTDDCEAILEYVYAEAERRDARWFAYFFTPIFAPRTSRQTFIWSRGFPHNLQKVYFGEDYRALDPMPDAVFAEGPILTWTEARRHVAKDPGTEAFLARMDEAGEHDGASFALYGPRNRDAYAVVGLSAPVETLPEGSLTYLHSMLQAAHIRICKIMDARGPSVALSEREAEVLRWVGRGKSSAEIAALLDIAPDTVRTYTKRIFEKLDTRDRVTATVRALKLGLVEL